MGRKRYMTKRRIEEKISKQRKASLFMVLVVMITAITLTYKNVDGDFSRLMGNVITDRTTVVVHVGGRYKMNLYQRYYGVSSISSADESIATVTDYGVIRGKKEGSTKIDIKYRMGDNYYHEYVDVVVKRQESYAAETRCVAAGGKWSIINGCTLPDKNSGGNNQTPSGNNSGSNQTPNNSGGNSNSNDTPEEKEESRTGTIVNPKLTINSKNVVLNPNKTYQLKVTSNVKTDKITYTSSDKDIAIVGSKGLIKGKKEGKTTIKVTSSSGVEIEVNVIVGKSFDIAVNYAPNSNISIDKDNKVILNVTDTKLTNVWVYDDKLNGNSIYEKEFEKTKSSGKIELESLPKEGDTKKFYVKTKDSSKLYSYTTFAIKQKDGQYKKSTGPVIKNIKGISIDDDKYITYTVLSSHGLSLIKDGEKNGKFDNIYSPNAATAFSGVVKLDNLTKSKNGYYYLWIHAADNSSFKNYTRIVAQIKVK